MEYFARTPSVLMKWAKHYKSNEPIPHSLISKALRKRKTFAGIDLQMQILYSAADQVIHSFSSVFLSVIFDYSSNFIIPLPI
jgi:intermediate peptidase